MRLDFSAPGQSFGDPIDAQANHSPVIPLYLYAIADKAHVQEVIQEEQMFSWDIPIYFGETDEFFVVTSPAYVNHGVFTEEAKQAIRPMWDVLRRHIENKGDTSVDQLAQAGE